MAHKESRGALTGVSYWQEAINGNVICRRSFLLLLLVPSLSTLFHSCASQQTDIDALLNFKAAVDPNGTTLMTWDVMLSEPCPHGGWLGVTCNGPSSVSSVELTGLGLKGTFAALGNLSELVLLNLTNNGFTSSIEGLTNLTHLVTLSLSENQLSGEIPVLTGLVALTNLDVSNNSLNGTLRSTFPSTLQTLDVSNNHLSGQIPSNIAALGPGLSFGGNTGLCGPKAPSSNSCPSSETSTGQTDTSSPAPAISPATTATQHHTSWKRIIILIFVDALAIVLIVSGFLVWFIKRFPDFGKKPVAPKDDIPEKVNDAEKPPAAVEPGAKGVKTVSQKSELVFVEDSPQKFPLEELLRASAEIMGKGSLGTTYRARRDNGSMVAVKRLKEVKDNMDKRQFDKHMEFLGSLKHPHLLPLRAYYYAKEEKLLVYDYMYNGSLASVLHRQKDVEGQKAAVLDWDTRLKIAYDVAVGLRFLHERCSVQTFPHQNLKSTNVLLGDHLVAYLADICLVPVMPTKMAAQTMTGYAAPEYGHTKRKSHKADIYSFGVLLLELLTGRQPAHFSDEDGIDLPAFVNSAVKEEWTVEVFDSQLKTNRDGDAEMVTLLQLAMRCVEGQPEQRPPLTKIFAVLESMMSVRQGTGDNFPDASFQSQSQYSGVMEGSEASQDFQQSDSDASVTR